MISSENDKVAEPLESKPVAEERARPGLQGMGWKIFLWLALLGLAPALLALPVLLPLADRSAEVHRAASANLDRLQREVESLRQSQAELLSQRADWEAHQDRAAREQSARSAFDVLRAALARVISAEKKPEELAADADLRAALESSPGIFSKAALLEASGGKVVLSKPAGAAEAQQEAFTQLQRIFAAERPPASLQVPGWHWAEVGQSGYHLAVYTPALARETPPAPATPESPAWSREPAAGIGATDTELTRWAWMLTVVPPLLALALLACAFLWLRAKLLSPLARITGQARVVLDEAGRLDGDRLGRAGLLGDLAAALIRLAERVKRLDELDHLGQQQRLHILAVEQALERAAAGDLEASVPIEAGECRGLALGVNRLLQSVRERAEAATRAAGRLKLSADRLLQLSGELSRTLTAGEAPPSPVDPGALAEILGIQLEELCRVAGELGDLFSQSLPRRRTAEELRAARDSFGVCGSGLRLLVGQVQDARGLLDRAAVMRRSAEVLSTNLAIAAEARSWRRIEELGEEGRALSRSISETSAAFERELDEMVRSGGELERAVERATDQAQELESILAGWEGFREESLRLDRDLHRQIRAIRPGAASLGGDVRGIARELADLRRMAGERKDLLAGVAETGTQLSRAADEILSFLQRLSSARPVPGAVDRRLADRQQALEAAVREVCALASREGIESLSEEAQAIIASIRLTADAARKRIRGDEQETIRAASDPGAGA